MLTRTSAPCAASSSTGSRRYRRRSQYCLSFQASSQMVRATFLPWISQRRLLLGGQEVSGLVEDVVGGQQHLALPEDDLAALDHRRAVGGGLAGRRGRAAHVAADQACVQTGGFARQPFKLLPGALQKTGLLDQIARRIAGEATVRGKQSAARRRRPPRRAASQDQVRVAGKVADRGIDLSQRDSHGNYHCTVAVEPRA